MRRPALWCAFLLALMCAMLPRGAWAAPGRSTAAPWTAAAAATAVCALACDTLDPSKARQETFPVPDVTVNGRVVRLHMDDADGMGWAGIDDGTLDDSVWLDRSWDGGGSWDGLLGKAWIPSAWTGTRTLMYNLDDPSGHRRGLLRACGDAHGVVCTAWAHVPVCAASCDGTATGTGTGDIQPVAPTTLGGRTIALHTDSSGMAWATLQDGRTGDEVWLDRSWNSGASWPDGSSLGRTSVPPGADGTRTARYNTDDPLGRLYGGAVRACGRAVEGQNGSCTAWARPAPDRVPAAVDALMYSYDPWTAYWPLSWWNSAVALATVIDAMRQTGDTRYAWIVARTFEVNRGSFPAGARSSDPIDGDFISRSTDDSEWWALAWIDAYDLTHDSRYLDEAVTIATYVNGLWDTGTCGGGVWWDRERTYKNAVTNGLWVRLTAELHDRLAGDTLWLGRATTAWRWFTASGLINADGLVNDGLTAACANNGQTVWTYNQGLAVGAAVEIWRATGDGSALATARRLADAALASPALVAGGVLTEPCDTATSGCDDNGKQFKGVFMRYLADLDAVTGDAYGGFAARQADAVWGSDRDTLNRLGERWGGAGSGGPDAFDWRTQASAVSALLADPSAGSAA